MESCWMPARGIGTILVCEMWKSLTFSPEPADVYQDVQGNQIVFWNRSGNQEYRITFELELSPIFYNIDPNNLGEYDTSDPEYIRYTSPSSRIESDNPEIKVLALEIIGNEGNPYEQSKIIYKWVLNNLDRQGHDAETALSTLQNQTGACGGHSFLYTALLRSIGIPARIIGGLTSREQNTFQSGIWNSDENTMGTHVWTEIYFPNYGWVQSDSTQENSKVFGIKDLRVVLFRGEDIELKNGYPLEIVPYFHMPQTDFLGNSDPATQTIGEYFALQVERLDD